MAIVEALKANFTLKEMSLGSEGERKWKIKKRKKKE